MPVTRPALACIGCLGAFLAMRFLAGCCVHPGPAVIEPGVYHPSSGASFDSDAFATPSLEADYRLEIAVGLGSAVEYFTRAGHHYEIRYSAVRANE